MKQIDKNNQDADMKTNISSSRVLVLSTVAVILTSVTLASAQTTTSVYTDPVGFVTVTAVGNGYSYVSLPLTQMPTNRGIITAVAPNTITVTNTMTSGQFNWGAGTNYFFIEITSGPNAGLMDDIVSNDTTNFYTSTDLTSLIATGQTYKVYPHWTLNTAFGTPANSGINGSNTQANADSVIIWNPVTQTPNQYWYRTTSTTPGWRDSFSTSINRGTNVVYIEQGITIQRKVAGDASMKLVGAVKLGPTISPGAGNGYTYLANVYAGGYTLSNSLLYTGISGIGVNGSNTQANADSVIVWDPITQTPSQYWYRTTSTTPGWRDSFSTSINRGTNELPIGCVILVQRKLNTGFNWVMPPPY